MNFQDQIQQIFGTTDIHELKQISRDADNYRGLNADMNNSIISEKKKNTGRKDLCLLDTKQRIPTFNL